MKRKLLAIFTALTAGAAALPASAQEIDVVWVEIRTGGDDLRGNDDNAFASVWSYRADGRQRGVKHQVNTENRRLADYTTTTMFFRMPAGTEVDDITAFHLDVEGFGGGFNGDNWNVDSIRMTARKDGIIVKEYFNEYASPLIRFTGENHHFYRNLRVK